MREMAREMRLLAEGKSEILETVAEFTNRDLIQNMNSGVKLRHLVEEFDLTLLRETHADEGE